VVAMVAVGSMAGDAEATVVGVGTDDAD